MVDHDTSSLARKTVNGVIALISRQFLLQLISIGSFFLISTVLLPADIGIYTAVIAMQRVVSFFTDFGLGAALVQKKNELTQSDLKTSFTIQSIITFSVFIIIFLLKDIISQYFHLNQSGQNLLLALVFTIFISSFKTIPSILLERKINFQKLVIPQITESLVFNVVLVSLVLMGYSVDSYTYAFLLSSLVGLPVYYLISPWKISFGIEKEGLAHLKFGLQFQAKNILATIKDDLLTVILTKFLSFTQIGYIGFAQRIAFLAYRYIVDSVIKVTFSSYSRIQDNKEQLKQAIEKSLFYISALMFPIIISTIILSPYIIHYFPKWQNKWEPAIISLIFFSLNAAVSSLSGILVNTLDATGKVKTTLNLMVIWTALTWILTPLLIYTLGFNGVAIASFIITLTIVYTVYLTKRITHFNFWASIIKPVISTLFMALILISISSLLISNLFTLFIAIIISGLVYLIIFYFLAKKELLEIKKLFIRKS